MVGESVISAAKYSSTLEYGLYRIDMNQRGTKSLQAFKTRHLNVDPVNISPEYISLTAHTRDHRIMFMAVLLSSFNYF